MLVCTMCVVCMCDGVYVLCMHACVISNKLCLCLCLCVSVLPWLMVSFRIARSCITFSFQDLSVFVFVFVYFGKYVCVYFVGRSVCVCVNVYVCMCVYRCVLSGWAGHALHLLTRLDA